MQLFQRILRTLPATPALLGGFSKRAFGVQRAPIVQLTTWEEIAAFESQHPRRLLVDVSRSNSYSETNSSLSNLLSHWIWEDLHQNLTDQGLDLAMAEIERADPSLTTVYEPAESPPGVHLPDIPGFHGTRWLLPRPNYRFSDIHGVASQMFSADFDFAYRCIYEKIQHSLVADNVTAGLLGYATDDEMDRMWSSSRNGVAPVGALLVQLAPQDMDTVLPVLHTLAQKRQGVAILAEISPIDKPRKSTRLYKYASYPYVKTNGLLPRENRAEFLHQEYASIIGRGEELIHTARRRWAEGKVFDGTRDDFFHVLAMDKAHGTLPAWGMHVELNNNNNSTNNKETTNDKHANIVAAWQQLASQRKILLAMDETGRPGRETSYLSRSDQIASLRILYNVTQLRDEYQAFVEEKKIK